MAGCSKEVVTKSMVGADDAWMYDVTLPVPVLFASPEVQTKAPVTAISNGMEIGVFGFRTDAEMYSDTDDGMNMRNANVKVNTKLMLNLTEPFYYPESDNFRFYSYHPYSGSYQIDDDGKVSVEIDFSYNNTLATHKDVLWAREDGDGGFNADLAREGVRPKFSYTHPAICVSFYAKVDKVVAKTSVAKLYFKDVPTSGKLCVADVSNPDAEGRFYEVVSRGDLMLTNGRSGSLEVELSTEPSKLGQDVFMYPDSEPFCLQVTLRMGEAGKSYDVMTDYVIRPKDLPDGKFLPGHHYSFCLNVLTGSSDISFTVTKDSEEDILDFDNEFQWEDAF